ncbi:hypothetical protein [Azonexus sp. R2A61]|nr:hypothetical protein [Azonexus sp. R2A61]
MAKDSKIYEVGHWEKITSTVVCYTHPMNNCKNSETIDGDGLIRRARGSK